MALLKLPDERKPSAKVLAASASAKGSQKGAQRKAVIQAINAKPAAAAPLPLRRATAGKQPARSSTCQKTPPDAHQVASYRAEGFL